MILIKRFIFILILLFAALAFGADVYIDPNCGTPGDGSGHTCGDDPGGTDPLASWSDVTFSASDDYYQKCGTINTINAYLAIWSLTPTSENHLIMGAYNGAGVKTVVGAKPIIHMNNNTQPIVSVKSQYLDRETNRLYPEGNIPLTHYFSTNYVTSYTTSGSLTLTQSLLKGRGRKVNLSLVKQSEVDRQISIYELRQYIMELVEGVQKTYWDLVLAKETLNIRQKSLELANQQLIETEERIRIGKEAESEIVTAQAEVASEKEKLIDVVSDMAQKKLDFILFLNPETDILWDQNIQLTTPPEPIEMEIGNIHQHIATSLKLRPDINQAYLNLQKGDLEVVRTKNGILPRLDFFLTLKSMANGSEFPSSLDEFDNTDYKAGIVLSRPLGNREAKSQIHRANLQRLKYQESMEYLKQKIQVEVRQAILEIERYREKIIASQANRKKQAEKLKVEQEKFRLGRSTNLMVFQAQRDLIEAEVNEVTAIINQIKTFIDLHMVKGTLLEQWSLDVIPPLSESP